MTAPVFTVFAERIAQVDCADDLGSDKVSALRGELDAALASGDLTLAEWRMLWEEATAVQSRIASRKPSAVDCQAFHLSGSLTSLRDERERQQKNSRVAVYYAARNAGQ